MPCAFWEKHFNSCYSLQYTEYQELKAVCMNWKPICKYRGMPRMSNTELSKQEVRWSNEHLECRFDTGWMNSLQKASTKCILPISCTYLYDLEIHVLCKNLIDNKTTHYNHNNIFLWNLSTIINSWIKSE